MGVCCPCFASNDYTQISDEDLEFTDVGSSNHKHGLIPQSINLPASNNVNKSPSINTQQSITPPTSIVPTNTTEQSVFRQIPDPQESEKEYDLNSPVFKGMVVQQKFFNKSSYDPKFVWINLSTRSLCLSEHSIKERRHKEANIADITGVIAGPPEKYKASVNANGETVPLSPELCLSVKFVRGGGIDLQFQTTQERDSWYQVITRLILQEKELRRSTSGLTTGALPTGKPQ